MGDLVLETMEDVDKNDLDHSVPDIKFFNRNKNNAILAPEEEASSQPVEPTTTHAELSDLYYNMSGNKYLHIFNHFKFKPRKRGKPTDRNGTFKDVKKLRITFEGLGFQVKDYQDLDYEDIMDAIHAIILSDHQRTSCVAVAVLTHGNHGGILEAADREYSVSDIHNKFVYAHNVHLANKPKLFFIQACRGDKLDSGKIATDGGGDSGNNFVLPSHVDILTLYSTSPDYVSWRETCGTWLIQSLCRAIEKYKEFDILQIITMVNAEVAHQMSYNINKKEFHNKKQVPETHYTLTKLLKF